MSATKRTSKALALLLPAGVFGISAALASTQAAAEPSSAGLDLNTHSTDTRSVAERLADIRKAVSANATTTSSAAPDVPLMLAEWLNFGGGIGWHNGGWGNGGWHNGGWGNGGWHNAPNWGNGGWHNWGNGGWHNGGWGNGWHNFWHNF
jgi:rSAM-associated Gly-rich repeat protein